VRRFAEFVLWSTWYVLALLFAGAVLSLRRLWRANAGQMDDDDTRPGVSR
jgi:hypothetical protein